jgi:hypothetical protein
MLSLSLSTDKSVSSMDNLIKSVGGGLKDAFLNPQKAAAAFTNFMYDNVIKSTFELDKQLADLNKTTGGFRKEFEQTAMSGFGGFKTQDTANLANYGIKLSEVAKVYGELSKSIAGFNNMSEAQRRILLDSSAMMTTLGVSATTYGNLVSKFMTSATISADQASMMMKSVAKDAIALGQDVGKYTETLSQSLTKVSGYAREATQIFKELSAISAATKGVISPQDLTALSDKFATFDTAADAVSKLNAMLGGTSLSIVDMMQKDPAEQILAIKRAASESGMAFDSLNIGYKRLLAEYFGGDMNKAAAFFRMEMSEAQAAMNKASATEEELAKRRQASVAAQEKLNATLEQLKISFTPLVDIASMFLTGINKIIDTIGAFPTVLGIGIFAFIRMRRAIGNIRAEAKKAIDTFTGGFKATGDRIEELIKQMQVLNTKMLDGANAAKKLQGEFDAAKAAKKAAEGKIPGLEGDLPLPGEFEAAKAAKKAAEGKIPGLEGDLPLPKGKFGKFLEFITNEKVLTAVAGVAAVGGAVSGLASETSVKGEDFIFSYDPAKKESKKIAEASPDDKFAIAASKQANFITKFENNFDQSSASPSSRGGDMIDFSKAETILAAASGPDTVRENNMLISQSFKDTSQTMAEAVDKNFIINTHLIENLSKENQKTVEVASSVASNSDIRVDRFAEKIYDKTQEMQQMAYEKTFSEKALIGAAAGTAAANITSTSIANTNNVGGATNNYSSNRPIQIDLKFGPQTLQTITQHVGDNLLTPQG